MITIESTSNCLLLHIWYRLNLPYPILSPWCMIGEEKPCPVSSLNELNSGVTRGVGNSSFGKCIPTPSCYLIWFSPGYSMTETSPWMDSAGSEFPVAVSKWERKKNSIPCTRSGNTVGCPSCRAFVACSVVLVILSFLQCLVELVF